MKHLIRSILRGFHQSRLRKAHKIIRDHRHLFRHPDHIAAFEKVIHKSDYAEGKKCSRPVYSPSKIRLDEVKAGCRTGCRAV
jgi:hypothetical protein